MKLIIILLYFLYKNKDKVALGAKPYKEEIEDLKTKLVEIDLEKMKNAKEFEKEYVFAITEHGFTFFVNYLNIFALVSFLESNL